MTALPSRSLAVQTPADPLPFPIQRVRTVAPPRVRRRRLFTPHASLVTRRSPYPEESRLLTMVQRPAPARSTAPASLAAALAAAAGAAALGALRLHAAR